MAKIKPSRILEVSSNMENNEQQYVEIGSNIYLGTKDGMKYSVVESSDNKFRLVEAPFDSSISLSDSNGSNDISPLYENSIDSNSKWSESPYELKEVKIVSVKSEASPCKGQGDEFENAVLSPHSITSSFNKTECVSLDKSKQNLTSENLNTSSVLTYTTLYPKQDKGQVVTYYVNPNTNCSSYSPVFPSPQIIRPTRGRPKTRMPFLAPDSPYTPIPKVRRGGPRMRRPRQPVYQYTPQILHSTPTNLTNTNYSQDSSLTFGSCSSGSLSSTSFSRSDSSIEYPRVPNNTPDEVSTGTLSTSDPKLLRVLPLQWSPYIENYISINSREAHNEKERYRRLRIKNACQSLREYMPWLSEKTDNATIFEEATNFIAYVRGMVGHEYDVEFVEQNFLY